MNLEGIKFDIVGLNMKFNLGDTVYVKNSSPTGLPPEKTGPRRLYTFICYHKPQSGHCMIIDMKSKEIEIMMHEIDLELVNEGDC